MTAPRPSEIDFDVVVAADLGDGIGKAGQVPWHLPGDLAHLKRLTSDTEVPGTHNAVLMGRVTWDSIPDRFRPLPGRLNVVISRQINLALPAEVVRATSLPHALELARAPASVERIFVLGGAEIYRLALALDGCRRIYLTRVLARYDCDAFFPAIPTRFRREALLAEGADGEGQAAVGYRIEQWTRARAAH
jgi:dihydrofolate reductase